MSANGRRPQSASSAGRKLLERYQLGLAAALQNESLAPDADSSTDSAGSVDNNAQAVIKKTSSALEEYLRDLGAHDLPAELQGATNSLKFQLQCSLDELNSLGPGTLIAQENFRQAQITEAQRFNEHVQRLKEENQRLRDENKRLKEQGSENVDPNVAQELEIAKDECRRLQEAQEALQEKLNGILEQHEQQMRDLNESYARQLQAEREQIETILQEAGKHKRENDLLKRQQQEQQSNDDYQHLQDELAQLRTEYEQLQDDHQLLLEEHEQLKEQLQQDDSEQLRVDYTQLQEEHQQLAEEHEQLKEQLQQNDSEQLRADYEQLRADYQQLQEEHGQLKEQHQRTLEAEADVKAQLARITEELKNAQQYDPSSVVELEEAQARIQELEGEVERLQHEETQLQEMQEHLSHFEEAANRIEELEAQLEELETARERIAELEQQLQGGGSELSRNEDLEQHQAAIDHLATELATAQTKLVQEQQRAATAMAELKAAQDKVAQQEVIINSNIRQNEAMQQSLEESRTTVENLRHRLQRSQAELEALREQLEEQKQISEQLRNTIGELDDQNKELTKQAAVRSQPQTPVHEPGSLASYLGEPATPMQHVEQLEQEVDDLRAEVMELQAALQEAQQQELNYCHELERLQAEMESRVSVAEQGQEDALYDGVNLHVNLATKEDVIRHYRIQLSKLEAANLKLDELLTEANQELAAEKDLNVVLKDFISKVAQKDDISEQLVKEMEQERDLLEQQHSILQRTFEETKEKLLAQQQQSGEQQAELDRLQEALMDKITTLQQSERDFQSQKQLLEDNIAKYQQELLRRNQLLESEMQAKDTLSQRYQDLQQQHDLLLGQSEGDTDTLERMRGYIDSMRAAANQQKALTQSIIGHVTAYQAWFGNKSSQLEKEVKMAIAVLHRRMSHLATVVSIVKSMRRSHQDEVATLQAKLAETSGRVHQLQSLLDSERAASTHTSGDVAGLRSALEMKNTRIKELEEELEEASRTETRLRREIAGLETAIQDSEDRAATASLNSAARSQLQQDMGNQYTQLDERLTALEQSLLDVSTQSARTFATRTREVAMLEGERTRAKKLIDHFRTLNAKLMGDLNDARHRATEAQFLQYRLEVATEAQKAAEDKCARLQRALEQREAETLKLMEQASNIDPSLVALHEQQVADARQQAAKLQSALQQAQEESADAQQKLTRALAASKAQAVALDAEVRKLQEEVDHKTEELRRLRAQDAQSADEKARRITELEESVRAAKRLNAQLTEQLAEAGTTEARVQELAGEKAALSKTLQTAQQDLEDLREQLEDKEDEVRVLQQQLQQHQAEEAKVRDADTQKVGELQMLKQRLAALIEQRDKQSNELAAAWKQVHNLQTEVEVKGAHLEHAQQRLKALVEAEQARETELTRLREIQADLRQAVETKEQRLASLQSELTAANREANVQGETIRELKQKNQTLQSQIAVLQTELSEYRTHEEERRGSETKIGQELAKVKEEKRQAVNQLTELDSALRELRAEQSSLAGRLRNSLFDIERENPRLALLSSNIDAVDANSLQGLFDKMLQCITTMNAQMEQLRSQAADGSAHAKEVLHLQKRLRDVKAEAEARAQQSNQLLRERLDAAARGLQEMRNERDDANMQVSSLQSQLRSVRRQLDSLLLVQMKDLEERARQVLGGSVPGSLSDQHSAILFGDHSGSDDSRETLDLVVVHRQLAGGLDESEIPDDDVLDAKMRQLTEGLAYVLRAMTTASIQLDDHHNNLQATEQEKMRLRDRAVEAEATLAEMKQELESTRHNLEVEQQKVQRFETRAASTREELAETQKQLVETLRECQDLRQEAKNHTEALAELRRSVTVAQEQGREKQARASALQVQLAEAQAELESVRRQLDGAQSKLTDAEMEVDSKNVQLKRLQADHKATKAAQAQLQLEVDRQRKELAEFRGNASSVAEGEARAAWVLQRLLTQLQSLFNQLRLDLDLEGWAESKDSGTRAVLREPESGRLDSPTRSEWLMKVLHLAANCAREIRAECERVTAEHRQCDNRLLAAEAKTDMAKRTAEALQSAKDDLEGAMREKDRSIGVLEQKLTSRDAELDIARERGQELQSQYSKLREEYHQQQLQAGTDAAELKRLRARLHQYENRENTFNVEMSPLLHELTSTKKRLEDRDRELKGVKAHNSTLQAQFDALSQELSEARASIATLRTAAAELERLHIEHSACTSKVELLTAQLEAKEKEVARWKESSDGRYQTLYDELRAAVAEKRALQDQMTSITLERDRLQKEVTRLQAEVDGLQQQLADKARQGLEATYAELRSELAAAEDARDTLAQKVSSQNRLLKKLQDQAARYAQEKEEAQKTDEALQKALTDTTAAWRRTTQQLEEAKLDRERALGEAKSVVQQRDTLAQEVGRVSHELDKAKRSLSELTNALTDPTVSLPIGAASPTGQSIERDPVSIVQQVLVAFKTLTRERSDLITRCEALKRECQQVQHDLEALQALHAQRERQYRAELNSLEDQLTLARQGDSRSTTELQAAVTGLRGQLEQERDARQALQTTLSKEQAARERAGEEIRSLREQIEANKRAAAQLDPLELRQARQANERLSRELQQAIALQNAQRDAINSLENRIRRQTERLAEVQSREVTNRAIATYADETKEPEAALRGRIERQSIRNEVLEDIVSIYRTALTNNQAPEAADHDISYDTTASASMQIPLYKLLEQEIKRMIELHVQEARITNCELLELRGRIAHQEVYVEELQKQVRQSSNALYQGGKSNLNEIASLETRRLRDVLKQEQESRQRLESEFARLKQAYQEKQAAWMADLVRATQARDVALRTAAQVELEYASTRQAHEAACREAEHYKSRASAQKKDIAELQKELNATAGELGQLQQTVENLRLNLNERDEQVRTLEKKYRRLKTQGAAEAQPEHPRSRGSSRAGATEARYDLGTTGAGSAYMRVTRGDPGFDRTVQENIHPSSGTGNYRGTGHLGATRSVI